MKRRRRRLSGVERRNFAASMENADLRPSHDDPEYARQRIGASHRRFDAPQGEKVPANLENPACQRPPGNHSSKTAGDEPSSPAATRRRRAALSTATADSVAALAGQSAALLVGCGMAPRSVNPPSTFAPCRM